MEKEDYLLSSFNNVQSLIRFADQKVASILLVDTITIGIFVSKASELTISLSLITFWGFIAFISGVVFIISNLIALYKSILKVLKPRFAKFYKPKEISLFYFEHIANSSKVDIQNKANKISKSKMNEELSAQLYEISKILNKKNNQVSQICTCLFVSIITFLIFLVTIPFL